MEGDTVRGMSPIDGHSTANIAKAADETGQASIRHEQSNSSDMSTAGREPVCMDLRARMQTSRRFLQSEVEHYLDEADQLLQELLDEDVALSGHLDQATYENEKLRDDLEAQRNSYNQLLDAMVRTLNEKSEVHDALQTMKTQKDVGELILDQYRDEILELKVMIKEKESQIENNSSYMMAEAARLRSQSSTCQLQVAQCQEGLTNLLLRLKTTQRDLATRNQTILQLRRERDAAVNESVRFQSEIDQLRSDQQAEPVLQQLQRPPSTSGRGS